MGYNHHTYIIQNPQSKYISFEYNAIGAVVYCNPQSILISLPINTGAFSSEVYGLSCLQLARSNVTCISCNTGTCNLPDVHALKAFDPRVSDIHISGKSLVLCYKYYMYVHMYYVALTGLSVSDGLVWGIIVDVYV